MTPRELVLIQLENLKKEKDELIDKILQSEHENIEVVKAKAAEEAETLYKKGIEDKVANQFRIAEEHLNRLLCELPAEEAQLETNEEEI